MKLRTKIVIDKFFGNILIFIIAIIIKIFRLFYTKKTTIVSPVKRIAICKLLGMGSIIQSTPLIKSIRNNFPNAEIIFVTSKKNKNLIKIIKPIDKIFIIDDRNLYTLFISVVRFKLNFLLNRIDIYIDLEVHSNFSTLLTFVSFARNKIGYYLKEEWLRIYLYTEMFFYNTNSTVVRVYNQPLKFIGVHDIKTELYEFENVKSINNFNIDSDYIIINPNASDLRIERRWDYKNYSLLINNLLKENGQIKIALIGSIEEINYVNKIYSEISEKYKPNIINTSGKLLIEELIYLIKNCKLMITNDSGPMHIAFALKKKTVALFGPCSPQQYLTKNNISFIYKNIYCSPCVHQFSISPCNGDNKCMKEITVEEVLSAVQNILSISQENTKGIIPHNL